MFQPVGGMDRIPFAFASRLDSVIRYGAVVTGLRQSAAGVTVTYRDDTGSSQTLAVDYCICAMPLTVARTLDADFSAQIRAILDAVEYDSAYKIAWEAPRFWEKEANIFGGISYLQKPVDLVWYPSARLFSEKGILIGGYSIEVPPSTGPLPAILAKTDLTYRSMVEQGYAFASLPGMQAKLEASRRSIEMLHPGHGKDLINPIYVSWGHIPYNLGSWINLAWNDEQLWPRCSSLTGASTSPATTPAASSVGRKAPHCRPIASSTSSAPAFNQPARIASISNSLPPHPASPHAESLCPSWSS